MATPQDWETVERFTESSVDQYGFPDRRKELRDRRTAQKQAREQTKRNRRYGIAVLAAVALAYSGGYLASSKLDILNRQGEHLDKITAKVKERPRKTEQSTDRQTQAVNFVVKIPSQPTSERTFEPELEAEMPSITPESGPEQIAPEELDSMTGGARPEVYQTGGAAPINAP